MVPYDEVLVVNCKWMPMRSMSYILMKSEGRMLVNHPGPEYAFALLYHDIIPL